MKIKSIPLIICTLCYGYAGESYYGDINFFGKQDELVQGSETEEDEEDLCRLKRLVSEEFSDDEAELQTSVPLAGQSSFTSRSLSDLGQLAKRLSLLDVPQGIDPKLLHSHGPNPISQTFNDYPAFQGYLSASLPQRVSSSPSDFSYYAGFSSPSLSSSPSPTQSPVSSRKVMGAPHSVSFPSIASTAFASPAYNPSLSRKVIIPQRVSSSPSGFPSSLSSSPSPTHSPILSRKVMGFPQSVPSSPALSSYPSSSYSFDQLPFEGDLSGERTGIPILCQSDPAVSCYRPGHSFLADSGMFPLQSFSEQKPQEHRSFLAAVLEEKMEEDQYNDSNPYTVGSGSFTFSWPVQPTEASTKVPTRMRGEAPMLPPERVEEKVLASRNNVERGLGQYNDNDSQRVSTVAAAKAPAKTRGKKSIPHSDQVDQNPGKKRKRQEKRIPQTRRVDPDDSFAEKEKKVRRLSLGSSQLRYINNSFAQWGGSPKVKVSSNISGVTNYLHCDQNEKLYENISSLLNNKKLTYSVEKFINDYHTFFKKNIINFLEKCEKYSRKLKKISKKNMENNYINQITESQSPFIKDMEKEEVQLLRIFLQEFKARIPFYSSEEKTSVSLLLQDALNHLPSVKKPSIDPSVRYKPLRRENSEL